MSKDKHIADLEHRLALAEARIAVLEADRTLTVFPPTPDTTRTVPVQPWWEAPPQPGCDGWRFTTNAKPGEWTVMEIPPPPPGPWYCYAGTLYGLDAEGAQWVSPPPVGATVFAKEAELQERRPHTLHPGETTLRPDNYAEHIGP